MKKVIRLFSLLLAVILLLSVTVSADSFSERTTQPYTYWLGNKTKTLTYVKAIYDFEAEINGYDLGYAEFSKPTDTYYSNDGLLYILEEGVSRLSVIDKEYKLVRSYTSFTDDKGEVYEFIGAQGVFVSKDNLIYIADTQNARILVADTSGKIRSVFEKPESSLIPDDFIYTPTKVTVDNKGYMYVISIGSVYGALSFDDNGEFIGFYGANTVKATLSSVFENIWSNFFATEEQLSGKAQKIPYQFSDIYIDNEDFVYTVTGTTDLNDTSATGQIRCLSPKSKNILTVKDSNKYSNTDSFNFGDEEIATLSIGVGNRLQNFSSVAVDDDGYIYALDSTYGRIYVYDSECNLLCAFGGGAGEGTQEGTFITANSIEVSEDKIFVTDTTRSSVTVFSINEYGKLLKNADNLYIAGDYTGAKELWQEINKIDPNCQLAYHGLARAYLIEKDYENAFYYAKEGLDYSSYNQAFSYVRNERLKGYFIPAMIILAVVIAVLVVFLIYKKKRNIKIKINDKLKTLLNCVIHPFEFANGVKYRGQGSMLLGGVVLIAWFIFRVLGDTAGGFLFSSFDELNYNSFYTLLGSVGLILLWVICYWAVAVLFSGKCRLKEVFIVSTYAILPQVINSIFYLIASNVLVMEEATVITAFSVVMLILSAIIISIGLMIASDYSFFKFIGVTIVAVFGMCVVIFVVLMVLSLDQQLFSFVSGIYKEVSYR